jgi:hypothetical protein
VAAFTGNALIANGATASNVIDTTGFELVGIAIPSAFTGASISFTAAPSATGTFQAVNKDDNTALSITVTASKTYALDPNKYSGLGPYFKIVSASAEAADRTIGLVFRKR